MSARFVRLACVSALVVGVGVVAAPAATAAERPLGNGSLALCFVIPLPGSADLEWCL
ncbi:hypothetical protein [Rhodococcus gannanensis]|uniref:Uncharacterized protein n=1 Tax=Rhodococcus gannanensis TaxID=1960308 RepID=A0ABW4P6D8_9NOCA